MAGAERSELPAWPIKFDSRRHVVWVAVISTLAAVAFVTLVALLPAHGRSSPVPRAGVAMVVIVGVVTFLDAVTSGRTRLTPTAILRVPLIGRRRWIAFADCRRVQVGRKALAVDIDGRIFSFPWDQMARGRKTIRRLREAVRGSLAADFDLDLPRAGVKSLSMFREQTFGVFTVASLAAIVNLGMPTLSRVAYQIAPSTQQASHKQFRVLFIGLIVAAVWLGSQFGLRALLATFFGIDVRASSRWAHRRSAGHGFEVDFADDSAC